MTSGNFEDFFTADPVPRLWGDAVIPDAWRQQTAGMNVILAADDTAALRVVSDAQGSTWAESWHHDTVTRYPFPVGAPGWGMETSDGRAGVLTSMGATADGSIPLTFAWRTAEGWHLEATHARRACLSSDGSRRVADDHLVVDGNAVPLPPNLGPQCQFARTGILFGDRGQPAGTYTFVGFDGSVRWTRPSPPYSWWTTSEIRDTIAYSTVTKEAAYVEEFDANGHRLRTIQGAASSLYTPTGLLVTVDRNAVVTWQPAVP